MTNKCVLIYDDEDEICRVCKYVLSDQYHVETFPNCINLFEDIDRIKPGLILIDLMMPQIDGASAITALLANKSTQHIPTIIFSASPDLEEISKRIKATAFIKKPFDIHYLRETIATHIKQP